MTRATETATLAGGCFWCLEAVFEQLKGVEKVESGYAGGPAADPTYKRSAPAPPGTPRSSRSRSTRPSSRYRELLEVFFAIHDPTTLNRQGHDVGTQYRSAIFYHSPEQTAAAEATIAELNAARHLRPADRDRGRRRWPRFYKAEDYHQGYFGTTRPAVLPGRRLAEGRRSSARSSRPG